MTVSKKTGAFGGLALAFVVALSVSMVVQATAAPKDEDLSLPADFRTSMVHLGSWFVPSGDASGFHDVYADRPAVDQYRRTGKWPDGAKLVKELRSSESGTYTTGAGVHRATTSIKQWFVMVKDTDGSGKGPLWGDGWGWALYKPDRPNVNVAKNYRSDCLGCHIPARATDYIYVDAYPTLTRPQRTAK